MNAAAEKIVPKGFKKTEVGIIPEEWLVKNAGNIFTKIQDGTHFSPRVGGNDYLYVTSKNIRTGKFDISTAEYIDKNQHKAIYKRCDVKKGDILLTKDGANTGNAALNNLKEEFSLLSSVAFLRVNEKTDCSDFYLQQIISPSFQQAINIAMSGNAITRLTLDKINKLVFFVPNKKEQMVIANALSDVDALISSIEKLIDKKRAIKTAAMQQLLTGKKRLPPFDKNHTGYKQTELGEIPEDWEVVELGKIAHIRTGSMNNQDKIEDGVYPFFVRSQTVEKINSFSYNCEAILVPGEGNIGSIFHYINGMFGAHQRVYVIRNFDEKCAAKYVFYYMKTNFGKHALENSVKATVDSLRLPTFLKFKVVKPKSLEEQVFIFTALTDMDKEIETLEQRLNKTQQIKQGMMQELLTGKTRLI